MRGKRTWSGCSKINRTTRAISSGQNEFYPGFIQIVRLSCRRAPERWMGEWGPNTYLAWQR